MSSNPTSDDAAKRTTDASRASDPDATLVGGTTASENGTPGTEVTHEPGLAQPPADPADPSDETTRVEHGTTGSDQPTQILGAGNRVSDSAPTEVFAKQATSGGDDTTKVFGEGRAVSDSAPTEVIGSPAAPADQDHPGATGYPVDGTAPNEDAAGPHTASERHDTAVMGTYGTETFDAEAAAAMAASTPAPGGSQQPPVPPPPPVGPQAVGSGGGPSRTRRTRRTLLIIGIVVAVLAVAVLAGGETYARRTVEQCISSQFEQEMGSKIDVSFGAKPMLITMFDNKVSSVTVDSDDTKFGPAEGMVVHAVFNDIEVVDQGRGGGTIGSSSAEVTWSNDGIAKTLSGLVSGVQSNPTDDTLTFAVLGGLAGLTVKPQVVGGKVEVTTESASLLGFGLPTALVEDIVDVMAQSLQTYPLGLQPTAVEVTSDGLKVTLAGGRTELPAAQSDTAVTC